MAITNAQQYKQLLAKGGRIGLKGGADAATASFGKSVGYSDSKTGSTGKADPKGGFDLGGGKGPTFDDAPATTVDSDTVKKEKKKYQDQFTSKGIAPPGPNRKARQRALNYTNKQLARYLSRFGSYYDPNKFSVTKTGYPNFGFPNIYEAIGEELEAGKELKDILKTGNMIPIGKSGTSFEMSAVPDLDIDSIRELAATQTTMQGAPLTGYQAGALKDLKTSIGKRDVLLDTGDTSDIYPDPPEATNTGPDDPVDPCLGPNPPAYCNINNTTDSTDPRQILSTRILGSQFDPTFFANEGGRAALAEGGMPYEGGIMDLESGRQMYFLGKLVKKATRAVKKIAKSPIGKAALFAAPFAMSGGSFGAGLGKFFGKGSLNPFLAKSIGGDTMFSGLGSILSKAGLVGKAGLPTLKGGLALTSLLPFLAGKEEDDFDIDAYYAANQLTPGTTKRQMGSEFDFYNYNLAEGGMPSKEPVAKKTMPLIDMDGQEMDLRAEGGFVPIGRMERADDVPARLSKNEFVFTADAVRNAGDGDIDKGAEVMYNMMKNLESGGEVSEESQGLDGAREMFKTSQRLEEVL